MNRLFTCSLSCVESWCVVYRGKEGLLIAEKGHHTMNWFHKMPQQSTNAWFCIKGSVVVKHICPRIRSLASKSLFDVWPMYSIFGSMRNTTMRRENNKKGKTEAQHNQCDKFMEMLWLKGYDVNSGVQRQR